MTTISAKCIEKQDQDAKRSLFFYTRSFLIDQTRCLYQPANQPSYTFCFLAINRNAHHITSQHHHLAINCNESKNASLLYNCLPVSITHINKQQSLHRWPPVQSTKQAQRQAPLPPRLSSLPLVLLLLVSDLDLIPFSGQARTCRYASTSRSRVFLGWRLARAGPGSQSWT